jgi:pimeloyl-ACP methyl ester carboxylesterase
MTPEIIATPLGPVEYSSFGTGTPILFVHGGHSNCQERLSHQGFDLSRFRLITPSRPGYGHTPLGKHKTPRQAADLIVALLDQLSIAQVVVYGISAGGLTAIELAASHPQRVSKLILASAISKKWLDKEDKVYQTAQRIFHPRMERLTWGMVRWFSGIFPRLIARSFYPQFSTQPLHRLSKKDMLELLSAMKHYRSGQGFLNDIDQQIAEDSLSRVSCPTLIVHSKHDGSVALEHAHHARNKIKQARLMELDNEWGHLFWIGEDAQETIAKVIAFIESR